MIRLILREKRFATVPEPVLAGIDVAVTPGEFVALLGPSGAGKTTILRVLAGLDRAFAGSVDTGGLRLGYLFQEVRLMPWLTAIQNVALVAGGDRRRAAEALADVSLEGSADCFPHQLSGGMQRRVALARAIAHEPQLLLLDEPFVSLDRPAAEQLHDLLLRYWVRAKPTIVLVSHNLDEALALADRVLFLGGHPATVVHEASIALPRPRCERGTAVAELRDALLATNPHLLSGSVGITSQSPVGRML